MNNQEMMERFTPVDAAQVAYFYGSAGQTGEGILMAEAIGAAVKALPGNYYTVVSVDHVYADHKG